MSSESTFRCFNIKCLFYKRLQKWMNPWRLRYEWAGKISMAHRKREICVSLRVAVNRRNWRLHFGQMFWRGFMSRRQVVVDVHPFVMIHEMGSHSFPLSLWVPCDKEKAFSVTVPSLLSLPFLRWSHPLPLLMIATIMTKEGKKEHKSEVGSKDEGIMLMCTELLWVSVQ